MIQKVVSNKYFFLVNLLNIFTMYAHEEQLIENFCTQKVIDDW